jgi:hemolysin type calcium-binding protein
MTRTLLFACLAAVLVAAEPAGAVLEGRNGRIAFTSGREGTDDNLAQLYLLNALARGADLLLGGGGKDRLIGGRGRDTCLGGPGRDRISCP